LFVSEDEYEKDEIPLNIFDSPSIWEIPFLEHQEGRFAEISPTAYLPKTNQAFKIAFLSLTEQKMGKKICQENIPRVEVKDLLLLDKNADNDKFQYFQTDDKFKFMNNGTSQCTMMPFDCHTRKNTSRVWEKGEQDYSSTPQVNHAVDTLLTFIINIGVDDVIRKHSKFKASALIYGESGTHGNIVSGSYIGLIVNISDDNRIINLGIGFGWIIWKYWRMKFPISVYRRIHHTYMWKFYAELCSSESSDMIGYVANKPSIGRSYFQTSSMSQTKGCNAAVSLGSTEGEQDSYIAFFRIDTGAPGGYISNHILKEEEQ
jgi:hypothetical protein